jgi:hypothetical protein
MTFRTEFPDFDPSTMPAIPADWEDTSWANDTCPTFMNEALGLFLSVDFADEALREFEGGKRFYLSAYADGIGDTLLETDDWAEVLAFIASHNA